MKKTAIAILIAGGAWLGVTRLLLSPSVDVVLPVRGPAVQAVYATGTVEATVMMPIAPRVGARLMELLADEGQQVTQGQVLAQLEDNDRQKTIDELKAREGFAQREFERKDALAHNNHVSKSAADLAKADWEAASAARARAEAEASYMKLLAPADGLVIKRDGEAGQMIAANQPVFWLSCCAPLRITTEVDEEDISKVRPDQEVLIRADAFPDRTFKGKVLSVTPKGDPIARSYRVRIGFTDENPLQIGMTAETNIIVSESKDALLVPSASIIKGKLWVVREGVLAEPAVTIGARGLSETEIREGLNEGDMVVASPDASLVAGASVRPRIITPITQ